MSPKSDPTAPIRERAASLAGVTAATACTQDSFKVGKSAFLFIGPGARGVGFKAMFKLDRSRSDAERRAAKEPERYQVGAGPWVTTRFTAEKPLPRTVWEKWLAESFGLAGGGAPAAGRGAAKRPGKR